MVYFIQQDTDGPIKIGYTDSNIKARLDNMQCASHKELRVIGYISGGRDREKQLHALFDDHRLRGEWFSPVEAITEYCQTNTLPLEYVFKNDKEEDVTVSALIFDDYFDEIKLIAKAERVSIRSAFVMVIKHGLDHYIRRAA